MSLQRLMPWLVAALTVIAGVVHQAAQTLNRPLSATAAVVAALLVTLVAVYTNRPLWRDGRPVDPDDPAHAMRRNTRLMAVFYAWGAAVLFLAYPVAGLRWQHGWQYGLAMAMVSAGLLAYVHAMKEGSALRSPDAIARGNMLTWLHGIGAMTGVVFVIGAGKLGTAKSDWVANHVFIAGGMAIAALCAIALYTQARFTRQPSKGSISGV